MVHLGLEIPEQQQAEATAANSTQDVRVVAATAPGFTVAGNEPVMASAGIGTIRTASIASLDDQPDAPRRRVYAVAVATLCLGLLSGGVQASRATTLAR